MQKIFLVAASGTGLLAVVFGAFGAHALRPLLTGEQLNIWEKGIQYQIYHALALFLCSLYLKKEFSTPIRNAAICFMLGILFFSGSLYVLATKDLTHIPTFIVGPLTPIGGFFFIAGWSLVLMQALKNN